MNATCEPAYGSTDGEASALSDPARIASYLGSDERLSDK